jgi:hypothetical protein
MDIRAGADHTQQCETKTDEEIAALPAMVTARMTVSSVKKQRTHLGLKK